MKKSLENNIKSKKDAQNYVCVCVCVRARERAVIMTM